MCPQTRIEAGPSAGRLALKIRVSKKAVLISAAAHAFVLTALLWPYIPGSVEAPGPGEEVQVWLAEPAGGASAGPGHAEMARSPRGGVISPDTPDSPISRSEGQRGDSADAERAGGVGGAGGPGTTAGAGGSELLARIWRKINASKYYPPSARRRGVTGAPRVEFAIDENGSVKWAKLVATSGQSILDDAALETVRRAAPLPYYPKPITVAVRYSLAR